MRVRRHPEDHRRPNNLNLSITPEACYTQAINLNNPPPTYQNATSTYQNAPLQITKILLLSTEVPLTFTKFHHQSTKTLLLTVPMFSRATEHHLPYIKSKIQYTKKLPQTTKLNHQITKQIHISEAKLPVQILEVINRYPLPNKAVRSTSTHIQE